MRWHQCSRVPRFVIVRAPQKRCGTAGVFADGRSSGNAKREPRLGRDGIHLVLGRRLVARLAVLAKLHVRGVGAVVHDRLNGQVARLLGRQVPCAEHEEHGVRHGEAPALVEARVVARAVSEGHGDGCGHLRRAVDGDGVVAVHEAEEGAQERDERVHHGPVEAQVSQVADDLGDDEGRDDAAVAADVGVAAVRAAVEADVVEDEAEDADAEARVVSRRGHLKGLAHDQKADHNEDAQDAHLVHEAEEGREDAREQDDHVDEGVHERVARRGADVLVARVADVDGGGDGGAHEGAKHGAEAVDEHRLEEVVVVALLGRGLDVLHGLDEGLEGDGDDDAEGLAEGRAVRKATQTDNGKHGVFAGVRLPRRDEVRG
mmetsp:Transcript_11284/g.33438  ORF Transcript_11284/g.33438 Transcript_11284/m.33438 type:complete len:374 (-) Transcript_11284:887-2008(-)